MKLYLYRKELIRNVPLAPIIPKAMLPQTIEDKNSKNSPFVLDSSQKRNNDCFKPQEANIVITNIVRLAKLIIPYSSLENTLVNIGKEIKLANNTVNSAIKYIGT